MGQLYDKLSEDVRFREGLKACIGCGTCTAICPAAEFYDYDPRILATTVQTKNDEQIEELLKGDFIWYCGECMSCKTRCPRGNTPGLIISALRGLSQELGYFVESEKGRQQLAIKRTVGKWILNHGYCLYPSEINVQNHPEQGPVWEWMHQHLPEVFDRLGANYQKDGPGIFRKVPQQALDELKKIFEVTGALSRFEKIEEFSRQKAEEMGMQFDEGIESEYFNHIYTTNNNQHNKK
ncbi:MAG: 4Fe-4S dicluster domain-containing protein [Bacteroidetes bacterium]|nr:4Fe-4S dicluster domain-containing protein [Bacteroidota bacterium]